MTTSVREIQRVPPRRELPHVDAVVRSIALRVLSRIRNGELEIIEDDGTRHVFGSTASFDVRVTVHVHSASFYRSLLRGSIGGALSYADGAWDCDDLVGLLRLAIRNLDTLERVQAAVAPALRPFRGAREWLRRNTRSRSRENIAQHYDIGNDLFELMLDDTMSYSAGIFERDDSTLREASLAKIDRLCDKLQLGPDDHLVEIGSGWGGLAVHAAQTYGCRVTTTTISREQHQLAQHRARQAGVSDLVTVLLEDYRDLRGTFTRLVSVEMIEAIGWRYYDTFFEVCSRLLADDGLAAIQAICQPHGTFLASRGTATFINSQIFPGGICPSEEAMLASAGRSGDLRLVNLEDITPGYPRTLAAWRENFLRNSGRLHPRFDERFRRAWLLYLCLCEAGFTERRITDVQVLFAKPAYREEPLPRWQSPAADTAPLLHLDARRREPAHAARVRNRADG